MGWQLEYTELYKLLRRRADVKAQRKQHKKRGWLPPSGAAAYGGAPDHKYGGARFFAGMTQYAFEALEPSPLGCGMRDA